MSLEVDRNGESIRFVSSEMHLHKRAVMDSAQKFLAESGAGDPVGIMVVFRELLLNAIMHGSKRLGRKQIAAEVATRDDGRFAVTLEDQGDGFNYRGLDQIELPDDPRLIEHRGYVLVYALSEQVEFNEKGNRVTAYLNKS